MKLRRGVKFYIEEELKDYHKTKTDYEELKEDIILEGNIFEGTNSTDISKPTERKAIKLTTNKRLKRMEQTIDAIESVILNLPEEKLKMIEYKYWQHPKKLTDAGIGLKIGCDRTTVWRWTEEILIAIALELGIDDLHKICNI